jgi:2-C-methyl-D-erythritol 4-phosphate cytidylyltransferase
MPDVIVVAAGQGRRMGLPGKTLFPLSGKPLLAWSVDVCQRCDLIRRVVIVMNESEIERGWKLAKERGWHKVFGICSGGRRRQDSVKKGLDRLQECEWVMIHDAARPFLKLDLIERGVKAVLETGAAIAAVPVKDTIKIADGDGSIKSTLERNSLWAAQTPQIFRFRTIVEAHTALLSDVFDDAEAMERMGYKVKLYRGSYDNIKITTVEDLFLAEIISRRIGKGV